MDNISSSAQAHLRKMANLFESRNPEIEYQEPSENKVVAVLRSYKSQSYTKLAQKIERISALEKEIKTLKEELKTETRENIADLFDAEEVVKTRVVETVSFIFEMTKNPKETVSPKYKDILEKLSEEFTPELIAVMEGLKRTMVTTTQKAPSLTVKPIAEGKISDVFSRLKSAIFNWGKKYDSKLAALKSQAGF